MSDSPDLRFQDLGLAPELLAAIEELGYETPSRIQAGAIPPLLEGRDLIGQAQTGTGKTAAFALPLLQRLDMSRRDVQAIVLTPTRELAMQVAAAVRAYGKRVGKHGVRVLPVYGGQPIHVQHKALRGTVHVVIGTPGRVSDHLRRGTLDLKGVHFFCLDEADEMLNMGFLEDVEWILDHAPTERQIALFSATMPPPIRRVAAKHLKDPADVQIEQQTKTVDKIEQASIRVSRYDKNDALERLLGVEDHEAVLIFVNTQRAAAGLAEHLQARGFGADCIHGGMNQAQRDNVVRRLRNRRIEIVVGTDVAARGLDVDHIGLVVNYDLPKDPEVYVHRVGRTARAGRSGRAVTLCAPREQGLLRSIERFSGQRMQAMQIPGDEELLARQRARMIEKLRTLASDVPKPFVDWARDICASESVDIETLAATTLRLAWGDGPLRAPPAPPRPDVKDFVEIVIPVGARDRIRPGTLVAAIAGATGMPGTNVGRINVQERVSFVQVPATDVEKILDALSGMRIANRVIRPRLAHAEGGGGRPRTKPHGKKPYPKKPYAKKPHAKKPHAKKPHAKSPRKGAPAPRRDERR